MNSCRGCQHIRREDEGWEMRHIFYYVCKKAPGMSNLRSFPFKRTTCPFFEASGKLVHDPVTLQQPSLPGIFNAQQS